MPQYSGLSDNYTGDPVIFTIDASFGADFENDCKLIYGSLQTAIYKLRNSHENEKDFQYVTYSTKEGTSYNLNQPVVFNVKY